MGSFFSKKEIRQFILRFFVVFFAIESLLILFPPLPYQEWLAQMAGNVLRVPVEGVFLHVQGIRFEISAFCAGFTTWGMLVGLLFGFTFPPLKQKIRYTILGFFAISAVNFLRILFIVELGKSAPTYVGLVHIFTWFVLSAFVFGGWYYLLTLNVRSTNSNKIAALLLHGKK